jgi:hypothetical protein
MVVVMGVAAVGQDLAASKGAEGGGERGGKRHDEGYAERAVERASASLASEVGQVVAFLRSVLAFLSPPLSFKRLRFHLNELNVYNQLIVYIQLL